MLKGVQPQLAFNWDISIFHETTPNDVKVISTRAKSSAIPSKINEVNKRYYAGIEYTFPGRDISPRIFRMTLWDSEQLPIWRSMYQWYQLINDSNLNENLGTDRYFGNIVLTLETAYGGVLFNSLGNNEQVNQPSVSIQPKTVLTSAGGLGSFSSNNSSSSGGGGGFQPPNNTNVKNFSNNNNNGFSGSEFSDSENPNSMIVRLKDCWPTEISETILSYGESSEINFDVVFHYTKMEIL